MKKADSIYRKLQIHLNQQPVGFPKTLSGSDIKLLKHFFEPEEARIALSMDHRFTSVDEIFERVDGYENRDAFSELIFSAALKGCFAYRDENNTELYALHPLIVGMYEGHLYNMTPTFVKDFRNYSESLPFGISYLSTELPQMRTIPVHESITPDHKISSFDEISKLLDMAIGEIIVVNCICRKAKTVEGTPCQTTERKETCIVVNGMAQGLLKAGLGRVITKAEAWEILDQNAKEGLVFQTLNTQHPEFICSCCGCCCGMLHINQQIPNPATYWPSNFHVMIDKQTCTGCGLCVNICPMKALITTKNEKKPPVKLNSKKCIGCGNCVTVCKFGAATLSKKVYEITPPKDHEDLFETIHRAQKPTWGKFKSFFRVIAGFPKH